MDESIEKARITQKSIKLDLITNLIVSMIILLFLGIPLIFFKGSCSRYSQLALWFSISCFICILLRIFICLPIIIIRWSDENVQLYKRILFFQNILEILLLIVMLIVFTLVWIYWWEPCGYFNYFIMGYCVMSYFILTSIILFTILLSGKINHNPLFTNYM